MAIYSGIYKGPPASYGGRTRKRYITIHNTSNRRDASAEDEASYAKNRTDGTSSHYYVDRDSIVQSLDTDLRANHVGSTTGNNTGIAYEITGTNAKPRSWWLENVAWGLLAAQIRADCAEHGIVPRLLTLAQIRDGELTGIITHDQARQVWGGTDHTDPGANFPLDHLIASITGDDMDLNDKLPVTDYAKDKWGVTALDVEKALSHGYVYGRAASDNTAAIIAELKAAKLRDAALLKAVTGNNAAAILERIDEVADADAARDAQILAEIAKVGTGEATAQEVLDVIGGLIADRPRTE